MKFRVGCSGWSYKHWAGNFYPRGLKSGDWFPYYASQFDTVELNTTFYGLPNEDAVKRWRDLAPPRFLFAAKASQLISHIHRLDDSESEVDAFLQRINLLGEHIGPLLVQLPPDFGLDLPRLEAFLAILPADKQWVFEFRHKNWWNDATYRVLSDHNASFCIYNRGKESTPVVATSRLAYMRFHDPEKASGAYSEDELSHWARRLCDLRNVDETFVYFNNDIGSHAPRDAQCFRAMIQGRA